MKCEHYLNTVNKLFVGNFNGMSTCMYTYTAMFIICIGYLQSSKLTCMTVIICGEITDGNRRS